MLNSNDSSEDPYRPPYNSLYDERNQTEMHVIEDVAHIQIHPAEEASAGTDAPFF
jgi:hypothetical protein